MSSLEARWAFIIPTCLASFYTTSSYKKAEMNAKKNKTKTGQIPGKPDEIQRKEFSKRQIMVPLAPGRWSGGPQTGPNGDEDNRSPQPAPPPRLRPSGQHLPAAAFPSRGTGRGSVRLLPRSPGTDRWGARPFTLRQRRRQGLTLRSPGGIPPPAAIPAPPAPSGRSLKEADVLLSVHQHSGRRDPVLRLHSGDNRAPLNLEAIS